jgi:hypothetical protein
MPPFSLKNHAFEGKLVICNEDKPSSSKRNFFDWNDYKLEEWKQKAFQLQEAHARDNNLTEWFTYKIQNRDSLELRILITIFGIRIPNVFI